MVYTVSNAIISSSSVPAAESAETAPRRSGGTARILPDVPASEVAGVATSTAAVDLAMYYEELAELLDELSQLLAVVESSYL